jgi:murein DD-endopeptidase MepM/ murein hydrolase activator NlpD
MPDDKYLDEFPDDMGESDLEKLRQGNRIYEGRDTHRESRLFAIWEGLSRAGLGEAVFKFGTHLLSVALVLVVIWAMRSFYLHAQEENLSVPNRAVMAAAAPTAIPTTAPPALPPLIQTSFSFQNGIPRLAQIDTVVPARPRTDVITYTVEAGDTVFGIAEQFKLQPETIMWSNYDVLLDNPHRLSPGQVLFILPVDGVYHKWSNGEGMNGVTSYYGVTIEEVVDYPGNNLDAAALGDLSNPNIEPGTRLIIPGGKREYVSWSAPRISRSNPSASKLLGPGACGTVMDGALGIGVFIWPANERRLSGFDYSPATNHRGIDIAGKLGDPLYASDNGVVVYAGWNNYGYGNVIVIDHGGGWQTLYAHMSYLSVGCGASVYQGTVIGSIGSTGNSSGPHLHFEMLHESYGKVNPWDFLK